KSVRSNAWYRTVEMPKQRIHHLGIGVAPRSHHDMGAGDTHDPQVGGYKGRIDITIPIDEGHNLTVGTCHAVTQGESLAHVASIVIHAHVRRMKASRLVVGVVDVTIGDDDDLVRFP